ncbi:hypothetical protein Ae168Ps1_0643 [Pseudonocardia sp. Ae168_Ps1]|nr:MULTISPECIES: hypothetical protein [unclassified Pseudonocardia]OLL72267.1 hypothetical protein Ae150APs1_0645 [Pseudonocardia sp. Ae150A_Ps1]OLL78237.1 hypothetical protein Ae168Ps1_0643 [Pseudonocardia sp. Ae168_Ps1]OLL87640.1 hypothetical protein Ae263Ps1_4695c [Pseudonocardia sp. Ae263_Ps1]OLL92333.1 hypothetical protein Ae356Ps1_2230 [Pseudonocardia sp. Ae356_Ps1]
MTALPRTSPDTATSPVRTSRVLTLAAAFLAAVSGAVPVAYVLLAM